MLKRLYHLLALLALANLFAVAGLVLFLVSTGRLNAERAEQIAEVLRGEYPERELADSGPVEPEAPPEASQTEIARSQARKEFINLVASRHIREMKDRRKLNNTIQLETRRLLEEIEATKQAFRDQHKQVIAAEEQAGFERQLTFLSKADPRKAMDLLKTQMKEPDVVRLLMEMDENRASKIVNACKTADELVWIGRLLNQIGKQTNKSANDVDGSNAGLDNGG